MDAHLITPRDWAGIALREATVMAGTPEGAAKLAESKRYAALADALHERDQTIAALRSERGALRGACVLARDGYISMRATGLPCLPAFTERTIEALDDALATRTGGSHV